MGLLMSHFNFSWNMLRSTWFRMKFLSCTAIWGKGQGYWRRKFRIGLRWWRFLRILRKGLSTRCLRIKMLKRWNNSPFSITKSICCKMDLMFSVSTWKCLSGLFIKMFSSSLKTSLPRQNKHATLTCSSMWW